MEDSRYLLIDTMTGKRIFVSTDELQTIYWLAENAAKGRQDDAKTSATNNQLPKMQRHNGSGAD